MPNKATPTKTRASAEPQQSPAVSAQPAQSTGATRNLTEQMAPAGADVTDNAAAGGVFGNAAATPTKRSFEDFLNDAQAMGQAADTSSFGPASGNSPDQLMLAVTRDPQLNAALLGVDKVQKPHPPITLTIEKGADDGEPTIRIYHAFHTRGLYPVLGTLEYPPETELRFGRGKCRVVKVTDQARTLIISFILTVMSGLHCVLITPAGLRVAHRQRGVVGHH